MLKRHLKFLGRIIKKEPLDNLTLTEKNETKKNRVGITINLGNESMEIDGRTKNR